MSNLKEVEKSAEEVVAGLNALKREIKKVIVGQGEIIDQLLITFQRHGAFFGKDFDARNGRSIALAVRHALGDPAQQEPVVVGVLIEAFAAASHYFKTGTVDVREEAVEELHVGFAIENNHRNAVLILRRTDDAKQVLRNDVAQQRRLS